MLAPFAPRFPRWTHGASLLALGWCAAALNAQGLAFRHFGLDDGLPQSQVQALLEDSHGLLWIGTNTNGLARLACGSFRPFGIAQGVRARSILALMEDRQGHIWAASLDNGLSEIAGDEVHNYGPDQGLASSQTYCLGMDAEGRVLTGTRLGIFRETASGGFTLVPLPAPWSDSPVYAMAQEGPDHLWIASRGGRIARWDGERLEEHPLPEGLVTDDFVDIRLDPARVPYVLMRDRLLRLENNRWVAVPLPGAGTDPKLRTLTFSGGGMQISLGSGGLWVQDAQGRVSVLTGKDGLPHESISSVLKDSKGTLWVGSDGDGMAAQALPSLRAIDSSGQADGLGAVMGVLELSAGDYLFATSTGIYHYKDGQGILRAWNQKDGMASSECWAPISDGHGGAWVGSDRGLIHWHPDGRIEKGPKELDLSAVVALVRLKDHLYAGTERGLYQLDTEGRYQAYWRPPREQGLNQVYNLAADGDDLLIGLRLGIYTFKGGTWEKRFLDAPFANQSITAMVRDDGGHLWVGTMGGLYEQRGSTWISHGIAEGLPDDTISFIQPIGHERLAIGHGKGVSILGPDGFEGRLTHNQGLISDETNHNAALFDSKGRLWIGMIGGLNVLDDASGFRDTDLMKPVVMEVRWPNGASLYPTSLRLPPHPSAVILSYAVASPMVPDLPRMQAWLEGVDTAWRNADGNTLHYLNLAGGNYRFRLRASADGLHWTEAAPVVIDVQLAWYEMWSVRILLALGAALLLGGFIWWRMRRLGRQAERLEEKIQERTEALAHQNRSLQQVQEQIKRSLENRLQLMDMVTHDLRSPLTSLTLSVDRLKEGVEDSSEHEMLMGILQRETHRMEDMVRQLLDRSRAESFFQAADLKPCVPLDLLTGLEEVLQLKAVDKGLSLKMEIAQETAHARVQADPSAMQQVLLNLFENAIKFTPRGGVVGIRSTIERGPKVWRLEVWDTGRGLTEEEAERILQPFTQAKTEDASHGWGLGLSICLNLLELHHGELRVRSEPGQGATFIISLPLIDG